MLQTVRRNTGSTCQLIGRQQMTDAAPMFLDTRQSACNLFTTNYKYFTHKDIQYVDDVHLTWGADTIPCLLYTSPSPRD